MLGGHSDMCPITQNQTPKASVFLRNQAMFLCTTSHIDSSSDEDEGQNAAAELEVDKAADYHAILAVLLETLKELIEEGKVIDIFFKGKLHKNCELVFFIPFVKLDGDEGDKLCCSYQRCGLHVQQLCRYCQCPVPK
jgi:hypothetical protein